MFNMTGINIITTTLLSAGSATGIMAIVEPKDLEGLGPTALFALITLSSLAVLVFFVRSQVAAIKELTKTISEGNAHIAVGNANVQELCSRLNVRPCLKDQNAKAHERNPK